MPSGLAIGASLGAGAVLGGYYGRRYASRREDFDKEDRTGFTGSSIVAGAIAGGALYGAYRSGIVPKQIVGAARSGLSSINTVRKGLMYRPLAGTAVGNILRRMGIGGGFKQVSGMTAMAGTVGVMGAVAGMAMLAGRGDKATADIAESDEMGTGTYTGQKMTTREKMGVLGATGDMVFGLNNSRHG